MLRWLVRKLAPAIWKLEMEQRMEVCEQHVADLNERFTRFQNRENMRLARSRGPVDADLAAEAAEVLASAENGTTASVAARNVPGQHKLDLWRRRPH